MRLNIKNYLISLCIFLAGCGGGLTVGGNSINPAVSYSCPTGANVMPVTVNGSLCNAGTMYINMPCVSVTICKPGSTTNCQTINNILLDTGSFGLRIFSSLVTLSPALPQTAAGDVAECALFGSGSTFGPVVSADVYLTGLSGEPKATVPIQLINAGYESSGSTLCPGSDLGPSTAGYNGILGVGLLTQDCGSQCTGATPAPTYFACTGVCNSTSSGACSLAWGPPGPGYCGTAMPVIDQVANPVPKLTVDNNGEVMFLPSLNNGGNLAANGCVIFGVQTATNNTPPITTNAYAANASVEFTVKTTSPVSTTNVVSFIDSGSNAIYIPSALGFPNCSGWDCPSNLTTVGITINTIASSFLVTNANSLFNTANYVFNDLSGSITVSGGTAVDLGINYFYGRPIWIGIAGQTTSFTAGEAVNTNGYWAY